MGFLSRLIKQSDKVPVEKRTLRNMRVGDRVTYDLEDYLVVGKLIFNDHGFQWFEYQLESHSQLLWVSVEMNDELEVSVYKKIHCQLKEPIPDKMEYEGTEYNLYEKGMANVHGRGRSANLSGHTVKYFDFCNEEKGRFLSVEIWGTEVEVSIGIDAADYDFTITAGS